VAVFLCHAIKKTVNKKTAKNKDKKHPRSDLGKYTYVG
jgi:hypothetical protein